MKKTAKRSMLQKDEAHAKAIEKFWPIFEMYGFEKGDIDFSLVSPIVIETMARALSPKPDPEGWHKSTTYTTQLDESRMLRVYWFRDRSIGWPCWMLDVYLRGSGDLLCSEAVPSFDLVDEKLFHWLKDHALTRMLPRHEDGGSCPFCALRRNKTTSTE